MTQSDIESANPRDLHDADDLRRYCEAKASSILSWCAARGLRIACAESLTGGLLADAFVRIPGASRVFLGSAVTYDIRAKAKVLGVDAELLRSHGAVDPEVARQMATLTAQLFSQPEYRSGVIGLSTTGVAGPGPDGDKPAGLVYIGVSLPQNTYFPTQSSHYALQLDLQGSRDIIRQQTVGCVLENLSQLTGSSQE